MAVQVVDLTLSSDEEAASVEEVPVVAEETTYIGPIPITRREVSILRDRGWLNDEIINAHLHLLALASPHSRRSKWHYFNSFFYDRLLSGHKQQYAYENVRRWTTRAAVDLFDGQVEVVIVPVNLGNYHWAMAYVDMRKEELVWCDSMTDPEGGMHVLRQLQRYLADEYADKKDNKEKGGWEAKGGGEAEDASNEDNKEEGGSEDARSLKKDEGDEVDDDASDTNNDTAPSPIASTHPRHPDLRSDTHREKTHDKDTDQLNLISQLSSLTLGCRAAGKPDFAAWHCVVRRDLPQQKDGSSCGLYLCQFAKCVVEGRSLTGFKDAQVQALRRSLLTHFECALDANK